MRKERKLVIFVYFFEVVVLLFGCLWIFLSREEGNKQTGETVNATTYKEEQYSFSEVLFFGDSRFAYMAPLTSEPEHFTALVGAQYDWMSENIVAVKYRASQDTVILIEFGVNDMWNVDLYIEAANSLVEEGYNVAYLTILPVDEEAEKSRNFPIKSSDVDIFNMKLKAQLDSRVIIVDGYDYLMKNGYETEDGIHYSDATNKALYNFIKKTLCGNAD